MDTSASTDSRRGVCVVGSINADLSVVTENLPRPGQTVHGSALVMGSGGKSANQAVAAARLGAAVELVGAVGGDEHGTTLLRALGQEGVSTTYVTTFPHIATGTALITVDHAGENTIVISPGANGALGARDVKLARAAITRAAVLGLAFEVDDEVLLAAARIAHRSGVRVVLNPSPYRQPHPDLLAMVDLLVLNEHELVEMLGVDEADRSWKDTARLLLERFGVRSAVVTAGARGAFVLAHQGTAGDPAVDVVHIPAVTVDVVDTTGCGDAFLGAVLTALAEGHVVIDAANTAAAVAAHAATSRGTQSSYPTRSELEALLDRPSADSS
jgi:ribokinase